MGTEQEIWVQFNVMFVKSRSQEQTLLQDIRKMFMGSRQIGERLKRRKTIRHMRLMERSILFSLKTNLMKIRKKSKPKSLLKLKISNELVNKSLRNIISFLP